MQCGPMVSSVAYGPFWDGYKGYLVSWFLGTCVVEAVLANVRPTTSWYIHDAILLIRTDLRNPIRSGQRIHRVWHHPCFTPR